MKSLVFLIVVSIALNGLLAGFLAGHLSHNHEHDVCKPCKCKPCDCECDGCRKPDYPAPSNPQGGEWPPTIDELKSMKGWVR